MTTVVKSLEIEGNSESSYIGHEARTLTHEERQRLSSDVTQISSFKQQKLENEAKKNWDLFYKRNETRFFKDRHWTKREFDDLSEHHISNSTIFDGRPILLEVGCGVGNFIFPLIEENTKFFIYACDFSPRAIQFVKKNHLYTEENCHAFQCDITDSEGLCKEIVEDTVNIVSMIFVLSAIHPEKMATVINNLYNVLSPGGVFLFRDYGVYDQAMLRFKPGSKLADNFYVRQDGTRAFYFSRENVESMVKEVGFEVLECNYVNRRTVNKKERIDVTRVFIQGRFKKPSR